MRPLREDSAFKGGLLDRYWEKKRAQKAEEKHLQIIITKKPATFNDKIEFKILTNLDEGEKVMAYLMDNDKILLFLGRDTLIWKSTVTLTFSNEFTLTLNETMQKAAFSDVEFDTAELYLKITHPLIEPSFSETFDIAKAKEFTQEKKVEVEKCLCKKAMYTGDDVKAIIAGLRKGEIIEPNGKVIKDSKGNPIYLDKNGKPIPNDSLGKPIQKGVIKKREDLTKFDQYTDGTKTTKIEDKIFYRTVPENITGKEASYTSLANEINRAIKELSLNSCLLRIHFFAQIYHETQRFESTYENTKRIYEGGNFYQGRGFIQITNKSLYIEYYKSIYGKDPDDETLKKFVPTLATSIEMAMKSAIWYWKTRNVNQYALKDEVDRVSAAINFPARKDDKVVNTVGLHGADDRRRYVSILKTFFDYENCRP